MPKIKAIVPERHFRSSELSFIDDKLWNRLQKYLPETLTAATDSRLRRDVLECCSWFLTENGRFKEGRRAFAAKHSVEQLAKGLRMAAAAWVDIGKLPDVRATYISRNDDLEKMAGEAERQRVAFRDMDQPLGQFVRKVEKCCRAAGLKPGITGRLYEDHDAEPTWFQQFIIALDDELLGKQGLWPDKKRAFDGSDPWRRAKAASIARAMRGDTKPSRARK
jgi:hypothetical protein